MKFSTNYFDTFFKVSALNFNWVSDSLMGFRLGWQMIRFSMPSTLKKLTGHIAFGLYVHPFIYLSVMHYQAHHRAYHGSEFVVANTLDKWKKLEPNEIDFSQGFSQKVVSRSCSVFNSLPTSSDFCHLLTTFANSLDPDQARPNVGPDLDPNCLTP